MEERGPELGSGDQEVWAQPTLLVEQTTTTVSHHKGPLPDPSTLLGYGQVQSDFPERIMRMAEANQQALIDGHLIDKRAEAWALRVASVTVTALPWFFGTLAAFLAVHGVVIGATVSAVGSAFTAGPQIIRAIRRMPDQKNDDA